MKSFSLAVLTAIVGLVLSQSSVTAGHNDGCESKPCKTCVRVTKEKKKTVYRCETEDYCLGCCTLKGMCGGKCDCHEGKCGKVRTRHLLVIKKVRDCDTTECVPVDADCCEKEGCGTPTFYSP